MATETLSTADALAKDLYVGPIVEAWNGKAYMLEMIERDTEHVDHEGRRAVYAIESRPPLGRGSRADAGTLPVALNEDTENAIINMRYHYQGLEVSDAAIEGLKSGKGAFVNIMDRKTKNVSKFMRKDINRQVFGTGNGLLASVAATATTTTVITLDSVQYVRVGDPVDVLVKSSGAAGTGAAGTSVVARVGGTTKTVTLATTVTVDLTHGVYVEGNRNNEMDGLRNIADVDRTLHSINSATAGNEYWDGQVLNVGTAAGSEAVAGENSFERLADDVGETSQGEVEVFLTTRGIRRRLADTYQSQKRFTNANAVNIHGGYSAIMVAAGATGEIPVVIDDDCPKTWAFGLDKDALRWFQQAGPGWMEKGGGGIFHLKNATTAGQKVAVWQAWFRIYQALGCINPQAVGSLRFCSDDNPE